MIFNLFKCGTIDRFRCQSSKRPVSPTSNLIYSIYSIKPVPSLTSSPIPEDSSQRSLLFKVVGMFDVPSCQPLADAFFDSDSSRVQISLVEYVGISSIDDGHRRAAVILPACSSQRNVVSGVEDHSGLREDRVVLDLRLSDGGAVVGEDDQLGLTAAQTAQSGPVAQHVLAALDHEAQLVVDVLRTHLFHHKKLLFNQIIFQDLIQQLYTQGKAKKDGQMGSF